MKERFMDEKFPVQTRFKRDELVEIDAFRRAQPNLPTRPEAVRQLTRRGLEQLSGGSDGVSLRIGSTAGEPSRPERVQCGALSTPA
jgi:hypothetical protein